MQVNIQKASLEIRFIAVMIKYVHSHTQHTTAVKLINYSFREMSLKKSLLSDKSPSSHHTSFWNRLLNYTFYRKSGTPPPSPHSHSGNVKITTFEYSSISNPKSVFAFETLVNSFAFDSQARFRHYRYSPQNESYETKRNSKSNEQRRKRTYGDDSEWVCLYCDVNLINCFIRKQVVPFRRHHHHHHHQQEQQQHRLLCGACWMKSSD